jgi:hypothetical protein
MKILVDLGKKLGGSGNYLKIVRKVGELWRKNIIHRHVQLLFVGPSRTSPVPQL